MQERGELLNLVAELRGRLDELERLVRAAPGLPIPSPSSYEGDGIVTLTPKDYTDFRPVGLDAALAVRRYEARPGFVQFGSPDAEGLVDATSFALSDLHRTGPEPAFGLRLAPQNAAGQAWFTYEFLLGVRNALEFEWLEWVLKLSFEQPVQSFVQFILEGKGFSERVDGGTASVSDFAGFVHAKLDRASLEAAAAGRPITRIRLTLSTGGRPLPLSIYGYSVFGKRA